MSKFFSFSLCLTLLLLSVVCFAYDPHNPPKISDTEMSLGGVRLGMSYQDVVNMYGVPKWKNGDANIGVAMYGKSIRIGFEDQKVVYIFTRANNGWKTPSGLAVGMKLDDAFRMYGKGDILGKGYFAEYYRWLGEKKGTFYVATDYKDYHKITYIELEGNKRK